MRVRRETRILSYGGRGWVSERRFLIIGLGGADVAVGWPRRATAIKRRRPRPVQEADGDGLGMTPREWRRPEGGIQPGALYCTTSGCRGKGQSAIRAILVGCPRQGCVAGSLFCGVLGVLACAWRLNLWKGPLASRPLEATMHRQSLGCVRGYRLVPKELRQQYGTVGFECLWPQNEARRPPVKARSRPWYCTVQHGRSALGPKRGHQKSETLRRRGVTGSRSLTMRVANGKWAKWLGGAKEVLRTAATYRLNLQAKRGPWHCGCFCFIINCSFETSLFDSST